jgi:hypothetical protein
MENIINSQTAEEWDLFPVVLNYENIDPITLDELFQTLTQL